MIPDLTPQETKIVLLICQQKSNKQIAYELGIAKRTAEFWVSSIMFKIEALNRVGVAIFAIRTGLFTP